MQSRCSLSIAKRGIDKLIIVKILALFSVQVLEGDLAQINNTCNNQIRLIQKRRGREFDDVANYFDIAGFKLFLLESKKVSAHIRTGQLF